MAFTPVIARKNTSCKARFGDKFWCFGTLTFTAGDTYVTGGMVAPTSDYLQQIRRLFGVGDPECILFENAGSANAATASEPSGAKATYDYPTRTLKLHRIGRAEDSASVAADLTEVGNGETIAAMRFDFKAICSGPTSYI